MSTVNQVFIQNLGANFELGVLAPNKINVKIGTGLRYLGSGAIASDYSTQQISTVYAEGRVSANGSPAYLFGATVTRTAVGRYTVTFDATHPQGVAYAPVLTTQSDEPNRDQRKIGFTNLSSTGFDIVSTVDDNGGTADTYADVSFSFSVTHRINVIVP